MVDGGAILSRVSLPQPLALPGGPVSGEETD